ncbi:MAG TPA: nucleotide exchange factor GrpE [Myxococcaceae bacterium]|nr:nucleotide exchange factor GrpE [Myxococcaceae bacterium]
MGSETGKFSTNIGEDVIAAALESVEKQRETASGEGSAPPAVDRQAEEAAALKARVEALEARERELSAQVDQERERTLRAMADLDNARKRAQREREEVVRYGMERVLKDLLPVVDNLDRALDLGDRTGKWDGLAEGVRMTRKLLEDTLGKQGLRSFSARGKPFDPHLHEAMGHEQRDDLPANTVSTEVLRGFTLHDRLVRPALVMVARLPSPAAQESATPSTPEPPAVTSAAREPEVAEGAPPSSETEASGGNT